MFCPIFAVFELPDELILSILFYISPDPWLTGHYVQFSTENGVVNNIYSDQWQHVEFLRPLSMTCRAMRLRLLPWVWERLEMHPNNWSSTRNYAKGLNTLTNVLLTDVSLAANVKYLYTPFFAPWPKLIRVL